MSEHVQFNQKLIDFLDASVSKYHAVSEITKLLTQNGFMRLEERDSWSLEKGGKYFVVRNNSSIIGFVNGEISPQETGLSIVGAHTDSPSLMLKPNPIIRNSGYIQLGVEVYGGALLKPWFDRDLSISGRIFVRDKTGELSERLVDFEKPIGFIPSLAIHLNRDANGNSPINAQTDILPILFQENLSDDLTGSPLEELLKSQFMDPEDSLLAHDLYLYDTQPASVIGLSNEFIASRCLDNLVSCYAGIEALLGSSHGKLSMVVLNDHEEVGSLSTTGADGPFLESIIRRLCKSWIDCDEEVVKARSMVLSCDNAHAVHPNFSDKHDPNHRP
jgi:aspartyl aminopeptidase